MDTSVVIPVYNEKGNIQRVTHGVLEVLARGDTSWEVLIVDDGSNDCSHNELNDLGSQRGVKLISHGRNLGKARALRTGFDHAEGNVIVTLDADGQHDPKYIPQFIDELCAGADMVVAKRINRANSLARNTMSQFYNWFLQVTLGISYSDFNSGYMAVKRECVDGMGFSLSEIDRYDGLHRYLIPLALINGFKVTEVPIQHFPRMSGKSFVSLGEHFLPVVGDHLQFMREHYGKFKKPMTNSKGYA